MLLAHQVIHQDKRSAYRGASRASLDASCRRRAARSAYQLAGAVIGPNHLQAPMRSPVLDRFRSARAPVVDGHFNGDQAAIFGLLSGLELYQDFRLDGSIPPYIVDLLARTTVHVV